MQRFHALFYGIYSFLGYDVGFVWRILTGSLLNIGVWEAFPQGGRRESEVVFGSSLR